jgi:hypothetical protein
MRLISNKILLFILINLSTTTVLVFFMWFVSKYFVKGALDYIGYILFLPSFLIVSLFKSVNVALHFTTKGTFLFVSFIFYSLVIATVQIFIYKRREKRQRLEK